MLDKGFENLSERKIAGVKTDFKEGLPMKDSIVAAVEALAEMTCREVEDLHVYCPSLKMQDIDLALALHARGITVTIPCLREERRENSMYSQIAVEPPQTADVLVVYRASDFYSLRLPYRLKLIITLQVPISVTLENLLAARGIFCLHAANLRLAAELGKGMVKDFAHSLLRQVDIPDTMKMVSEVLEPLYQGWEEIAMLVRKVPDVEIREENTEEIRIWRRLPSIHQCQRQGTCNLPEGPDFVIQRRGRPMELISLAELQKVVASVWAVWVNGRMANLDVLLGLLDCKQQGCPFINALAKYKEAA